MCTAIVVAIEKIKPDYKDRVDFQILDAQSDEGKAASTKHGWDLGPKHGMVMERGDEVLGDLSGHGYKEDLIRDMIDKGLQ